MTKYENVEMPAPSQELVRFAYFLRDTGEVRQDSILTFFENPEPYQKLWNAWIHYYREGFDNWQIVRFLIDEENGGWKTDSLNDA